MNQKQYDHIIAMEQGFTANEAFHWLNALEEGFDIGFIGKKGVFPVKSQGVVFDVGNLSQNGSLEKIYASDDPPFVCLIYGNEVIATEKLSIVNFLGLTVFFGSIVLMALLYESRKEPRLRKQIKNIASVITGGLIIYSICCLMVYFIHGQWVLPYLWF